jgi:uncharacterized protein (DUF983 family)
MSKRFVEILFRSLRLRCPLCGQGKLFRSWFRMHENCPNCGVKFEREGGFFLGSIYINYGLTSLVAAIVYPILLFKRILPNQISMALVLAFVLIFPLLFFPLSRSLWLGFDEFCDPREAEEI